MGILILGVEAPKDCCHCWIPCTVDFGDKSKFTRPENCPCLTVIENNSNEVNIFSERCKYFGDGKEYGNNLKVCMATKGMPTCRCGGDITKCER